MVKIGDILNKKESISAIEDSVLDKAINMIKKTIILDLINNMFNKKVLI